nr:DHHW family protein [Bacillota bacterium]MDY5855669.1 DHHW family protein [Anaerovoracaceae bacterium]
MKKNNLILISVSAVLLLALSIGTLLKPDVDFSPNENRYLQKAPEVSAQNILSGQFSEDAESYLSDQIIGREKWVGLKGITEAGLGVRDMNGVYLCDDGRAVERITEEDFDWNQYARNLNQLAQVRDDAGIPMDVLIVPSAASIYEETLPDHALRFDEEKAFEKAEAILGDSLIDLRHTLKEGAAEGSEGESNGGVFFKSDHHWTNYGAFLGYKTWLSHLGVNTSPMTYAMTEPEVLSDDFHGTLYSKVLLNTLGTDTILAPAYSRRAECTVEIDGETYDSIYFDQKLDEKDKYAVYFGGNYDRVDITCMEGDGAVLIIKDSFANSFVPYLMGDYEHITMVDPRYFREDVTSLTSGCDRILVIYSIKDLAEQKMNLAASLMQ